jgi:ppGpp synthetase/RelA/SpoT-type nucleotidyltranferase
MSPQDELDIAPAVQPELSVSEAEAMAMKRMEAELEAIMREFDTKHVDDLAGIRLVGHFHANTSETKTIIMKHRISYIPC